MFFINTYPRFTSMFTKYVKNCYAYWLHVFAHGKNIHIIVYMLQRKLTNRVALKITAKEKRLIRMNHVCLYVAKDIGRKRHDYRIRILSFEIAWGYSK